MSKTKQGKRLTIGFLTDYIASDYYLSIWHGVMDLAQERDVNLVCFIGSALDPTSVVDAAANVTYALASAEALDGMVVLSSTAASFKTPTEAAAFCRRYHPMPVVSAGLALEGIPSVSVDNEEGLREMLSHLIEDHGVSRLAFIRGPEGHQEADLRYRVYTDVLAAHGLPLDPDLVAPGTFMSDSGVAAVSLLIDERGLKPGVDFDAITTANDDMVCGAIEELQARGIRVPYDVAVAGFDDVRTARFITPPLTTVRQPTYEMGRRAVEMLLALLAGEDVPEQVTLPTRPVVRQSCGCLGKAVAEAAAGPVERVEKPLDAALAEQQGAILTRMTQALEAVDVGLPADWRTQLLDSLAVSTEGKSPDPFLDTLDEMLRQAGMAGGDTAPPGRALSSERSLAAVQRAVSVLRREMLPILDRELSSRTENLWNQAQVMVSEMGRRIQAYQALQAEQQAQALRAAGQALLTTFDVERLMDVLAQELPRIGFPSAYLSLYEKPETPTERAWLALAYDDEGGGRVELKPEGERFPSRHLVPQGLLPQRRYTMILQSLFFREHQLGFTLLEAGPREGMTYHALWGEISSALQGALLLKAREEAETALEQAYAEVEKQIQERTAELQREIAEREKAQDEALHLQMEVIEAQKRAIQELSTPIIPVLESVIVMPLIGSVDSLRARDLTRRLLAGIREHRARVAILDITGVPIVDSGVASHLNKTIQAARLKGARTIITGISDAVAETIVDLGIDWSGIDTLADLQTGLRAALRSLSAPAA